MTGLHTGHARVRGNALRARCEPEDVTVAEVLKKAGYATGLIGKWGLGEPDTTGVPNRQGFDYLFGYLNQGHAHNYYPDYLWNDEQKVPLEGNAIGDVAGVAIDCRQYSHDLWSQQAEAFLDQNKDRPFFLYLAFTIPHANNEAGNSEGNGMEIPPSSPAAQLYADRDWPEPQKGHAAMITRLDGDVGRLLDTLSGARPRRRTRSSSSPATTAPTRKAAPIPSSSTAPARSRATSAPSTKAASACR